MGRACPQKCCMASAKQAMMPHKAAKKHRQKSWPSVFWRLMKGTALYPIPLGLLPLCATLCGGGDKSERTRVTPTASDPHTYTSFHG